MHSHTHSCLIGTFARLLAPLALLLAAPAASADPVRLIQSDERGVTLQLDVHEYRLMLERSGRSGLAAGRLDVTNLPGRPALPVGTALIALPPGARPVARVIESAPEEVRERVRLAPNGRSILQRTPGTEDFTPVVEPVEMIRDGAWPATPVELGDVFSVRRQRVVAVRIQPFRYDETSARLWSRRSVKVRVDFVGGRPTEGVAGGSTHWDRVLRGTVLNFEQARAWKARPEPMRSRGSSLFDPPGRRSDALGANRTQEFDEGNPEVRVQTDTTGVYAFRFDDLAAKGYPAGIPVGQVSVHRHEFLENAYPSYETVELPIEVDDANTNGVFDSGDRIVLFVLSWAQRSRASFAQRAWGDGEVLYATFITERAPLRMPARPGWRDLSLTPLLSFPHTERFEKTVGYTRTPADTNADPFQMSPVLFYPRRDSFPFDVYDLDSTGRVTATVSWSGTRGSSHTVWAQVRNFRNQITTIADSVRFSSFAEYTRSATLFGSSLSEGPLNYLRTWGKSDFDNLAYATLNWFQFTYWRYYLPIGGRLDTNNGDATGVYEISAYGFLSNALRVYDVTDSLNPVRLTVDPSHIEFDGAAYTISFQDSSAGRRHYWVFDEPKVVAPEKIEAVVHRDLASQAPTNYLIVAPEAWLDVANTLADFRRTQGFRVLIAPLESIEDEFNGGRRSSYALKRFFRYAYDRWDSEFIVLLGDGSEDPQNLLVESGTDWVPLQKARGPVIASDNFEIVPNETWLVAFEPPTIPGGAVPSLPSMFLGRIPANSHDALAAVVAKIIQYETVTPDQTWRRDMLLLADDKYSTTGFGVGGDTQNYCEKDYERVFAALSDTVRQIVTRDAGLSLGNVELFDVDYHLPASIMGYNLVGNPADPDTCRLSWPDGQQKGHSIVTPRIMARLNEGRLWWNYQGHANQYVLAHEDLYVNRPGTDDKELLENVGKPFLFSGFSCHPNGFGAARENSDRVGPSLGEDMVMLPDRGAMASWGSTAFEILPQPVSRSQHLNTRFANRLFANPPRDPGDNGSRVLLGEVIAQTLLDNYAGEFSSNEQDVGWTYVLLGDPGSRISIGAPQIVVTANGVPVTSGEPVRLFTFGDSVRIDADLATNVAIQTLTVEFSDANGTRVLDPGEYTVTPAFPDTGVASSGGRRFHITVRSTLSAGSYRYVIRAADRYGVPVTFDVVFEFQTVLRADGVPIQPNDPVRSDADLSVLILSPSPIDPSADVQLLLNGVAIPFTATPFQGDTTRREYLLTWSHAPYAAGRYELEVRLGGETVAQLAFTVSDVTRLDNLMAFPNPFDDELGTRFSFTFTGGQPFDLLVRVFTVSGRLIYERIERGLTPGYHQLAWDGRDAEGQKLANGIYFYKVVASSDAGDVIEQGRLVKLRRPRRSLPEEEITPP